MSISSPSTPVGVMDDKQKKAFIIAGLRRLSYRWPPRYAVQKAARVSRGIYKCALCEKLTPKKQMRMDHIEPVINPLTGLTTWDCYISRLLVDEIGWQYICKPCHDVKTKGENVIRRKKKSTKGKVKKRKKK